MNTAMAGPKPSKGLSPTTTDGRITHPTGKNGENGVKRAEGNIPTKTNPQDKGKTKPYEVKTKTQEGAKKNQTNYRSGDNCCRPVRNRVRELDSKKRRKNGIPQKKRFTWGERFGREKNKDLFHQ